jgi:carboxylesterase
VRLAGHGTDVKDMIRTRYQDWLASVEDGWNYMQGQTERVFVIGLSLGGVLSLTFSAKFPVAGVVALSAPYEMPSTLAKTLGPLLIPMSKIIPTMKKGEDYWFNPEMEKDHVCYPTDPVRPAYELMQLLKVMRSLLPTIKVPALVIQSRDDASVLPENGIKVFEHLGSPNKKHIWIEKANHVITRDGDTSKVFKPIAEFIQTYST